MVTRKPKKTEKAQASLTEEEMIALQAQAESEGISVSQLIRKIVRNYLQVMGHMLIAPPKNAQDASESNIQKKKSGIFNIPGTLRMM